MVSPALPPPRAKSGVTEGLSDTACLDNAIELLVKSGYSLRTR